MSRPRVMSFYLEPGLKESAEAGQHNFLGKIADAGRRAGMEVMFCGNSAGEVAGSDPAREFAVMHMDPPPHANAVTVRRAYYYPFWSIERSEKRWEFDVARASFHAAEVPEKEARGFVRRWRRKWFDGWAAGPEGHAYVPLQGRLLEKRSFQVCSPVEMIEAVLEHDPNRPVIAALHPKERYSASELAALERLEAKHDRLTLTMGGVESLLPGCDYVVTQNSAVGFAGYFFDKPLVLCGRIDFHHIALSAQKDIGEAIRHAPNWRADYDAYLWWFLQKMAINAGRPEADEKIAARLRGFGWPV